VLLTRLGSAHIGAVVRGGSGNRCSQSTVTSLRSLSTGSGSLLLAKDLLEASSLVGASTGLLLLEISKATSLGVDLLDLSATLSVEIGNLLACGCVGGLLKVGAQAEPEAVGTLGDSVALIGSLGPVGGVVLLVETLEGGEKAVGDAVGGVEVKSALDGGITYNVAVGEVLSQDTGAGLLLLSDLVGVAVSVLGSGDIVFAIGASAGDLKMVVSELSVVEEESSLLGSLLLEDDFCGLGLTLLGDLDIRDLAAEAEEVLDLAVASGGSDVLDVDSRVGRHFECVVL
jgi:hypothetical protein